MNATHLEFAAIGRQESSVNILVGLVGMVISAGRLFGNGLGGWSSVVNLVRLAGIRVVIGDGGFIGHRFGLPGRWSPIIFVRFIRFDRVEFPFVLRRCWLLLHCCRPCPAVVAERVVWFDEGVVVGLEWLVIVVVDGIDWIDGFLLRNGRNCLVAAGQGGRAVVVCVLGSRLHHHDGHRAGDEL